MLFPSRVTVDAISAPFVEFSNHSFTNKTWILGVFYNTYELMA
jgi:hypothetical protein